jgi:hypothetical protein
MQQAFLAQSVERTTLNRVVVGSIPTEGVDSFAFWVLMHYFGSVLFSVPDLPCFESL